MKILRGAVQHSGYQIVHLVDLEDSGILRFEETGEMPKGMDFAVLWRRVWRQDRCYLSYSDMAFVNYQDVQRFSLHSGMQVRLPLYLLSKEHLLELARTYAQDLG